MNKCRPEVNPSGVCNLCGDWFGKVEQDHIIPLSHDGKHDTSNLQWLCRSCHAAKTKKDAVGFSGHHHTEEAKAIIREANRDKRSPETRAAMSAARLRYIQENPDAAFRHTQKARLGKTVTPETIEKIRAAKTGKPHSPEHNAAISAGMRGKSRGPYAKK